MGPIIMLNEPDQELTKSQAEYMALINMIGYTTDIAKSLGSFAAATHLIKAREILLDGLEVGRGRTTISDDWPRNSNLC